MGKPTGFMDYARREDPARPAGERIGDFDEFHFALSKEERQKQGGLLMYGIPNMKLDKSVILRRIDLMAREGVRFQVNVNVDAVMAKTLLSEFDAVILACGATEPRIFPQAGAVPGVSYALPYLKEATRALLGHPSDERLTAAGKRVVVVGAGDTSADCLATAIRQGAVSVTQLIRKPRELVEERENLWGNPIPFRDYAEEEAVAKFGESPRQYETVVDHIECNSEGKLVGVVTARTQRKGKKMEVLEEGKSLIPADLLLIASGFSGCEKATLDAFRPKVAAPRQRVTQLPTRRSLWQGTCEEVPPSWSEPSPKAAKPPRPWTPTCWGIPICCKNAPSGIVSGCGCRGALYMRPGRHLRNRNCLGRIYSPPLQVHSVGVDVLIDPRRISGAKKASPW